MPLPELPLVPPVPEPAAPIPELLELPPMPVPPAVLPVPPVPLVPPVASVLLELVEPPAMPEVLPVPEVPEVVLLVAPVPLLLPDVLLSERPHAVTDNARATPTAIKICLLIVDSSR
jgi:hypothetical protein